MPLRILDLREATKPISFPIRNVAVVTTVQRNGKTVVGYGFNSNGR